jgi:hypothetical protein
VSPRQLARSYRTPCRERGPPPVPGAGRPPAGYHDHDQHPDRHRDSRHPERVDEYHPPECSLTALWCDRRRGQPTGSHRQPVGSLSLVAESGPYRESHFGGYRAGHTALDGSSRRAGQQSGRCPRTPPGVPGRRALSAAHPGTFSVPDVSGSDSGRRGTACQSLVVGHR